MNIVLLSFYVTLIVPITSLTSQHKILFPVQKWLSGHNNRLGLFWDNKWHFAKNQASYQLQSAPGGTPSEDLARVAVAKSKDFHVAVSLARDTSKNVWGILS